MKIDFLITPKYKTLLRDIYVSNSSHKHAINIIHDETKLSLLIEHINSHPEDISLILAKLDGYLTKSNAVGESGYVILTLDILQYFVRHFPKHHLSILEIHINYVLDVILDSSDLHLLKASALLLKESITHELFQLHASFLRKLLLKVENQSMEATCIKFLMLISILNINAYNQTLLEKYYSKMFRFIIFSIVTTAHQLELSSSDIANERVTVNSKNVVQIIREAQLIISNLTKLSHTLQDTCAFDILSDVELATTNVRVLYELIWKSFYSLVFYSNVFSRNFAEIVYETCEAFFEKNHRIDSKIFFQIIYFIYKIYKIISSNSLSIPSKELNSHKYDIVPVEIILYQYLRDHFCIGSAGSYSTTFQLEGSENCLRLNNLFIIYLQAVNSFIFHWYNFVLKFDYSVISCPFLEDAKFGNKTYEVVEKSVFSIISYLITNFSFIQSWDLFGMFTYDISTLLPETSHHVHNGTKNYYCNVRNSTRALHKLPEWMTRSVLSRNPWNCNVINEATETIEEDRSSPTLWMFEIDMPRVSKDTVEERNKQNQSLFHTINQLILVFAHIWNHREYPLGSSPDSYLPHLDSLLCAMNEVESVWISSLNFSHSAGVITSSKLSFRIYSYYIMLVLTTDVFSRPKSTSICSSMGWESIMSSILNAKHLEKLHFSGDIESTSATSNLIRESTKCLWLLAIRVVQHATLFQSRLLDVDANVCSSNRQYLLKNTSKFSVAQDYLHACIEYSNLWTANQLLPWKLSEIVQLLYVLAFCLTKSFSDFTDNIQFCWNIHELLLTIYGEKMFILSLPVLRQVAKHCEKESHVNSTTPQKYLRLYVLQFFSYVSTTTLVIPELHARMVEWNLRLKSASLLPIDIFIDFTNLSLNVCEGMQAIDTNFADRKEDVNFFTSDVLKLLLRCSKLQKDSFEITKLFFSESFVLEVNE